MAQKGIHELKLDSHKERLFWDDDGYALFMKPRDLEDKSVSYLGLGVNESLVNLRGLEVILSSRISIGVAFKNTVFPVDPEYLRTAATLLLYEQAAVYARNANSPGVKMMSPSHPELLMVQKDDGINYHAIATFALLRPRENLEDM